MRRLTGTAQHYAWGDVSALPSLLGFEPDGRPWAEWWLGTHPLAPSSLDDGTPLREAAGDLPYLVKLLSAAEPLSLQTHPDAATAAAGFASEDLGGVRRDAPDRTFRDPFAKPEVVCALTDFEALCGFRPVEASVALLEELGLDALADLVAREGLRHAVAALLGRHTASEPYVAACVRSSHPTARLVVDLDRRWPGDPAAVVAALLHHVVLRPGEALHLGPGNVHAYLHGTAVEVMGPSDNVVRAGLTNKHVDIARLLAVAGFDPIPDPVVRPVEEQPGRWRYPTPGTPFELWRWVIGRPTAHVATGREIIVCTAGSCTDLPTGAAVYLAPGETLELDGEATLHRVVETPVVETPVVEAATGG